MRLDFTLKADCCSLKHSEIMELMKLNKITKDDLSLIVRNEVFSLYNDLFCYLNVDATYDVGKSVFKRETVESYIKQRLEDNYKIFSILRSCPQNILNDADSDSVLQASFF